MKAYLFVLVLTITLTHAQESSKVSGKVVDQETGESLSFATISVSNTSLGVVANEFGQFDLMVPSEYINDSIVVSFVGYQAKFFSIKEYLDKSVFHLNSKAHLLEEVVVTDKNGKLTGEEILREAMKKQKANFPSTEYELLIFFRETNQLNNQYFKLTEAAATIQGKKYPNTNKKIYIDEIRSAYSLPHDLPIVEEYGYNPFREFQALIGKIGGARPCRQCKYEVEKYTFNDDHLVALISSSRRSADGKDWANFHYWIDLDEFSLLKMEFEASMPPGSAFVRELDGYQSSLVFLKRTFEYKKYQESYFLNRYHQQARYQFISLDSTRNYHTDHTFNVMTNAVKTAFNPKKKDELMDYKKQISESANSYNKEFWANYNILKQSPLDEKIIKDLSSGRSIDLLFNENE